LIVKEYEFNNFFTALLKRSCREEDNTYEYISGFDSGLDSGSVLTETVFPSKEPSL
jgi:hypothetical protein